MKYFFDTEFIENGITIDLISIGIVSEDGRTLYKQNRDCKFPSASDWVWRNVFPSLTHFSMSGTRSCNERQHNLDSKLDARCHGDDCPWAYRFSIRDSILEFCDVEKYGKPEFWGYYADYDWVVFCQIFGTMMQLPKGFPMYCRDVKQLCDEMGNPKLPENNGSHNALEDALHVQKSWKFLADKVGAI
jgi:hypothetical protein